MDQKVKHLGIIIDGNRRWARSRGLPPFEGHRAGYKKIKEVTEWCRDAGIKILTIFAFSTENWQRPKEEVDFLMGLFYLALTRDIKKLLKENVCVRIIGRREGLPKKLQEAIKKSTELTKNNTGCMLNLAINYGGRPELVDAFKKILADPPQEITEETISKNLNTAGQPDPDLIIRTSGEQRLSGFLTWQSAYSELLFINNHWPEFSKQDFDDALADFDNRQRRFGK
ncbi:MAG: polyprenyl diphosphate synthase [bacterium]|nr:polyprenyl diphosphate synthase [bacterium]